MDKNETNELIEKLLNSHVPADKKNIFRDMLLTVIRLGDEDAAGKGDLKLLNHTLKELRHAFKIFANYTGKRKVTIFGSARTKNSEPEYQMAKSFAQKITKRDFMVITGAGGGIMEAGNEGAGINNSFGVNIKLPFEQKVNQYIKDDHKCMTFKYFFSRKLMFVKEADATVLFPGGFGTLDEAAESLTLFQTGKCRARPIILMEPENCTYWDEWLLFIKENLWKKGLISENDMKLFSHYKNIDDAVDEIVNFYKIYNSMRYMGDKTVLYLTKFINGDLIADIKQNYSDIIPNGEIRLESELDCDKENFWASSHYLIFKFNRKDFGRLYEMIQYINKFG